MGLETATHINQLVATNPDGSDPKYNGDDHLRMIKSVLTTDFANIGGAVTATHTELNYVAGVTSAIQTQFTSVDTQLALKAPLASPALTGTPTTTTPSVGAGAAGQIASVDYVSAALASAATTAGLSSVTPGANLVPLASAGGAIAAGWNPATAIYSQQNFGGF